MLRPRGGDGEVKKAWNVIFTVALLLLALGGVVFGLSLLMDADLVRVADAVFAKYDLAKVIVAARDALGGLRGILPF